MKRIALLLLVIVGIQAATTPLPRRGQDWYQADAYIPDSATDVITDTVFVDTIYLANTSGGSVTVTIKDRSTACGGSACQWWPTVTIAANTVYTAQTGGKISTSGVNWVASTASAVVGHLKGSYTR